MKQCIQVENNLKVYNFYIAFATLLIYKLFNSLILKYYKSKLSVIVLFRGTKQDELKRSDQKNERIQIYAILQ